MNKKVMWALIIFLLVVLGITGLNQYQQYQYLQEQKRVEEATRLQNEQIRLKLEEAAQRHKEQPVRRGML